MYEMSSCISYALQYDTVELLPIVIVIRVVLGCNNGYMGSVDSTNNLGKATYFLERLNCFSRFSFSFWEIDKVLSSHQMC